jgi:hypothetical protein
MLLGGSRDSPLCIDAGTRAEIDAFSEKPVKNSGVLYRMTSSSDSFQALPKSQAPRIKAPPWQELSVADVITTSASSSRAFLVGHPKVYSVRCEADVVMTSAMCCPVRAL